MANTQKYLNHLLQNMGITPACSEEERIAADDLAAIFRSHGFDPEVQEFTAGPTGEVGTCLIGILLFLGTLLLIVGGTVGVVGFLLTLAVAVITVLEKLGHPIVSNLGASGLSQNVIAHHAAEGPLASPRNRPVVVVAHYDSPHAKLFAQMPYAQYRGLLKKAYPFAVFVPVVAGLLRFFPFPGAIKVILWLVALVAALIPLAFAVAYIVEKASLPYTSGAVCNKSGVAAMLGVMDAVAPYQRGEEFPSDRPFDEYFAEIKREAAEAMAAAEAELYGEPEVEAVDAEGTENDETGETGDEAAADGEELAEEAELVSDALPAEEILDTEAEGEEFVKEAVEEEEPEPEFVEVEYEETDEPGIVNASGCVRHGAEVVAALGMLPEECSLEYTSDAMPQAVVRKVTKTVPRAEAIAMGVVKPSAAKRTVASIDGFDNFESVEPYEEETFDTSVYGDATNRGSFAETLSSIGSNIRDFFARLVERIKELVQQFKERRAAAAEEKALAAEAEAAETFEAAADEESYVEGSEAEPTFEEEPADTEDETAEGESSEFPEEGENDDEPVVDLGATVAAPALNAMLADEASEDLGATVAAPAVPASSEDLGATVAAPAVTPTPNELDSIMAEIEAANPAPKPLERSQFSRVPDPSLPSIQQVNTASRSSLFDLPDPGKEDVDIFSSNEPVSNNTSAEKTMPGMSSTPEVPSIETETAPVEQSVPTFTVISSNAPLTNNQPKEKKRGFKLFGRKKQDDDSMSEWLGVDDSFDAKQSGRNIGSWDNFDDSDNGWKGGAVSADGEATDEEMISAVASMGDDELLGHDIWFVASGASERNNAGIKAFLAEHREGLHGVFLINLEGVGAGELSILATEGDGRILKGDRRIASIVNKVAAAFHTELPAVEMPYLATDAYAARDMSLRSLTIAGVDGPRLACSHNEEDEAYNIEPKNIAMATEIVTEVIRRS